MSQKGKESQEITVKKGNSSNDWIMTVRRKPFWLNSPLSLEARGFLMTLLNTPPEWKDSIKGYSTVLKISEYKIRSAVKELKEQGYLKTKRHADGSTTWTTYEYPLGEGGPEGGPGGSTEDKTPPDPLPVPPPKEKVKKPRDDYQLEALKVVDNLPEIKPYVECPHGAIHRDIEGCYKTKKNLRKAYKPSLIYPQPKGEKITAKDIKLAKIHKIDPDVFRETIDRFYLEQPDHYSLKYFWIWDNYYRDAKSICKQRREQPIIETNTMNRLNQFNTTKEQIIKQQEDPETKREIDSIFDELKEIGKGPGHNNPGGRQPNRAAS